MKLQLPHLSYANVMSTVALFVALGGTSYAAVELGRDTVGSQQVVNGSIESGDIATGGVRSSDVRDGTLTHKDIRDGTLRGGDIATNTISSRNLVDNGIQADDIGTNSVTGRGVVDGSLGGSDIANGSITAEDLASGVIPKLESPTSDGPADEPSLRTLGNGAKQAAAGDDPRLSDARTPEGAAGGDLDGSFPNPTLGNGSIDSTSLFASSLRDGAAGVPTLRSLGTGADEAAAGDDPRLSDARTPTGAAGGALTGTYPNPTLGNGVVGAAQQASLPHGRIIATTAQTLSNGGYPEADFDSAPFLSGMTFDNANDRLVISRPGAYMVTAEVNWPQNGTGDRAIGVFGSNHGELVFQAAPAPSSTTSGNNVATLARLDAGETLSVNLAQSTGGPFPTEPAYGRGVALTASWVSP